METPNTNYAALILGVLHGLLAGRKAIGTFVYWSYGAVLAMLAIAVLVRILATSLRSRDMVAGAAPLPDNRGSSSAQSMPVRAAALGLMGQMSGAVPLGGAARTVPALRGGNPGSAAPFASPYAPVAEPARAVAALPDPARRGLARTGPAQAGRLPRYEPGYDGPPRPVYPAGSRPDPGTGPQPVYPAGSRPSSRTGPQPVYPYPSAYASSSAPAEREFPAAYGTGPEPRYRTGPQPVYDSAPRAGRERDYTQDHPYGADPGYGQGYGPEPGFGPDQGYDAEPGDHGPDPYGPRLRRPPEGYGGPPGYRTGPGQPQSGPRRRPQPRDRPSGERTGPLPQVPSYGGDERR